MVSLPCFADVARSGDSRVVNAVLIACLQQMALDMEPLGYGAELLAAVMKEYGWLRGTLAEAWYAVNVWSRAVPKITRVGIDVRVLQAVLVTALVWQWPRFCCLAALMFHGLLRPGEGGALLREDVRLPSDGVGLDVPAVILCIRKPKTRHRAARVQSVLVHDPLVVILCEQWLPALLPREPILPGGSSTFSRRLGQILVALGLSDMPISAASLRPGGALELYKQPGASLLDLMYRGRWDNPKTLSHYLQEGFAALAATSVPQEAARLCADLAQLLPELVSGPA